MKKKWSQDLYIDSYLFAERAHRNQVITGTDVPYIAHPGFVCMELMMAFREDSGGHNENLAIQCGLLHDVIEDTEITYEQIAEKFGNVVADGVLALTKDENLPKEKQMNDSLQRLRQQPIEVQMVKLADRISNLCPPPAHWTKVKIAYYQHEARLIHEELKDGSLYLAARLLNKIEAYSIYL